MNAHTTFAETAWALIGTIDDIPRQGSRRIKDGARRIAVFRTADDRVFALEDKCPHKNGPLSQGIVHGKRVTCPLHGWNIGLEDGHAVAPDVGSCGKFEVKVENGMVMLAV